MKSRLKLTDNQSKALNVDTHRNMIRQLIFIDTPKYQYWHWGKWSIADNG